VRVEISEQANLGAVMDDLVEYVQNEIQRARAEPPVGEAGHRQAAGSQKYSSSVSPPRRSMT
jgi:hypothetical protein